MTVSSSIHISVNDPVVFLFVVNIPMYICTTSGFFKKTFETTSFGLCWVFATARGISLLIVTTIVSCSLVMVHRLLVAIDSVVEHRL